LYNGKEKSGHHTAGNDLKVIKTRSGHTILMNDSEDKMSITILDIAGNTIWTSPISYGSRFEMYYLDARCVQENTTAYVFDPKVDFDKDIKNPLVYYYTQLIYA
jgi:hypothetical protein